MTTLERWAEAACAELGLPPDQVRIRLVLDLARDVAHAVERPAAPLTAFLLGLAVGAGQAPRRRPGGSLSWLPAGRSPPPSRASSPAAAIQPLKCPATSAARHDHDRLSGNVGGQTVTIMVKPLTARH